MQKRGEYKLLLFPTLFILIAILVYAQGPVETPTVEQKEFKPTDKDFWQSSQAVKSASGDQVAQGLQSGAIQQAGAFDELTASQLAYGDPQNLFLVEDVGQLNDKAWADALDKIYNVPGGVSGSAESGTKITKNPGGFTINRIDRLSLSQISITNGINVVWNNGVLTADAADSLEYKGSSSSSVIKLSADGKEFSVEKAKSVQAGCFLAEEVENARFVVGVTVTMMTSGNGKVVYDEGAKLAYGATTPANSSLTGSTMQCRKPTYAIKNMEVAARLRNVTELVNGSGDVQVDSNYGVVCVNLTPVSTYDLDTPRVEDNFGFLIKEAAYKLCIQKAIAQKLVSDCPQCGLVDLANQKIILNGMIEYRRHWYDSALIKSEKQRAFRSLGTGTTVIDMSKNAVIIQKDAPGIGTYVSNYLELHEHDAAGGTHRFLGIHEDIDRLGQNWAQAYTATYAPATTTIIDNLLDYQRGNCHVAVLPPNHPQIAALLSSLQQQEVRFP